MRKLIFLPALILAAAMLSTAVSAQDHEMGPGEGFHHHHGEIMHALKELDLSDEQKAGVKQLFKDSQAQLKPQFDAMVAQRQAFIAATPGTPAFQAAAANLAQAESALASAHVQRHAAVMTQVYNLLTDAQKAKWAALQMQHQAKFAEWQAKHAQDQSAD